MNGGAGGQLNLMAGQNNPAAMHFAQMQAKLAEFHSHHSQAVHNVNSANMGNNEKGVADSDEEDERECASIKSDESRSQSPEQRDRGSADENGSDRSTPPTWAFKMGCNFCNSVFSSSTELAQHIRRHYESKLETNASPPSTTSEPA